MPQAQQQIVLFNVSGSDRVGLMASLMSELACFDAQVLDIGQSIVHDQLVLGVLARFADQLARDTAMVALNQLAAEQAVELHSHDIAEVDYEQWVAQQGRPRYILTLLCDGVSAAQLGAIARVVTKHGLNILDVVRLSNRLRLLELDGASRVSFEMTLRGSIADELSLKRDLLAQAGTHNLDCSIQLDSVYRRNRRLVAFDMDSTLIQIEVIDELARMHGVYAEVAAVTEQAMAGKLDFIESFRARVALLKGLPYSALERLAQRVPLTDGAEVLLRSLKHFGYSTAIISGGFQYVGEAIARSMGIDHVFANSLEFDGQIATGAVQGRIIDARAKADILGELCRRERISPQQAIAIGDGANDLEMLASAGLGIAFHAKPVVQETASHAISHFGLDSVLYLLGFSQQELDSLGY